MSTHRERLAWVAGFMDAEGCFAVYQTQRRYPRAIITQRGPEVPAVLLRVQRITELGNIQGPYSRGKLSQNGYYQWRVFGFERVQALGAMIWAWLAPVKRAQFRKVMEACRH